MKNIVRMVRGEVLPEVDDPDKEVATVGPPKR